MREEDYKAIWAWGIYTGSLPYYIKGEQKKALAGGAPIDTLFESFVVECETGEENKRWVCLSDLEPEHEFARWFKEQDCWK